MGYEQAIPPIPDRKQELKALQRLEESWLNQSYFKYYMNESLREPKLAYSKLINTVYGNFYLNLGFSMFAILPLSLLARRFFITRGGIPITYTPDYFGKFRPDKTIRTNKYLKVVVPFHIVASLGLATYLTNFDSVFDPKYEFVHKTPVMM